MPRPSPPARSPSRPDARLPTLYAILDVDLAARRGRSPLDVCEAWLESGVDLVQLRAKALTFGPMLALADALRGATRRAGARLIVNDRADVARLVEADGVHVGQDDLDADAARAIVGGHALVGLSTHSAAQARQAAARPVSYVAIGPVFATATKARPDPVIGLAGVRAARDAVGEALPVVAIGGITVARAAAVLAAGADAVAVAGDLLDGEAGARARAWVAALDRPR